MEQNLEFQEEVPPGIIYIVSNPSMPGLIKIGKTKDLDGRVKGMSASTSVPTPFVIEFAAAVDDVDFIEASLHEAFSPHRVNQSREFFRMPAECAIAALRMVAKDEVAVKRMDDPVSTAVEPSYTEMLRRRVRLGKKDPAIVEFVQKFRADFNRDPTFADMRTKFPDLPKSTAHRYQTL